MKYTTRKLLSLLMVIAMLCSMIPTALAAASYTYEDDDGIMWTDECDGGGDHDGELADCDDTYEWYECDDCNEEGRLVHDWVYDWYDEEQHEIWCANKDCDFYSDEEYADHEYDDEDHCIYCEREVDYELELKLKKEDDIDGNYYEYDDDSTVTVIASIWDNESSKYIDAEDIDCYFSFDWEGDLWNDDDYDEDENVTGESFVYLATTEDKCKIECTVYLYDEFDILLDEAAVNWTFYCEDSYDGELEVTVTVSDTTDKLYLDDEDDDGNDSIEDQIADAAADLDLYLEYIKFSNVSEDGGELNAKTSRSYYYWDCVKSNPSYEIADVYFTPEEDYDGDAEFEFTAYCYDEDDDLVSVDGIITIEVTDEDGNGKDDDIIEVSAVMNIETEYLYLDDEDDDGNDSIEDQIADAVSDMDYYLEYIEFYDVSVDGGDLNAKTTRSYYYWDCVKENPSYEISEVYFTPEDDFDGEVEFEFTAYCYDDEDDEVEVDGIIIIEVTNEDADTDDSEIEISVPVEAETDKLYLDDEYDDGNDSIEDQIADAVSDLDYYLEYVKFSDVSEDGGELNAKTTRAYYYWDCVKKNPTYEISDVYFTPEEDYVGDVEFAFTAYCYNEKDKLVEVDGILIFEVDTKRFDPIYQMAVNGENTELSESLFVEFWESAHPNGTLKHVTFNDISSGKLYDSYISSSKKGTSMASKKAYLDPTSKQYGLDDLTFVPSKNISTVTIEFTATGTTDSQGKSTVTEKNSIVILYTKNEVSAITYNVKSYTLLSASNFTSMYKEVMGVSSVNTDNLSIKFLSLPIYGSLCMNSVFLGSSTYGTAMTESDLDKYTFGASTTAKNKISEVSYFSAGIPASVTYACYYGNALKFIGTIDFEITSIPAINLNCTTMGTVFKAADFFNANNIALKDAAYITFEIPSSGTLYKNFVNGTGTKVTATDKFASSANAAAGYLDINTVGFKPAAAGETTLTYRIFYRNGGYVNGSVKFTVTAPVSFTDVPVGSYYYDAVRWAVEKGITNGTTPTTYSPAGLVTREQVVTYLWRAAGSPEPKSTANPFVDVSPSDYCYKAVLWAVEKGYINGTSATTFSPKVECTYAMIVTLLWRSNGWPSVPYTGTEYYSQAVAWANSLNLLSGTTSAFAPTANANRAAIVTYMYRAAN